MRMLMPGSGGRLVTEKGLWMLLDAMERVRSVEWLDIIGEGSLHVARRLISDFDAAAL